MDGSLPFPKGFKEKVSSTDKCALCAISLNRRYLQIDHKVPFGFRVCCLHGVRELYATVPLIQPVKVMELRIVHELEARLEPGHVQGVLLGLPISMFFSRRDIRLEGKIDAIDKKLDKLDTIEKLD